MQIRKVIRYLFPLVCILLAAGPSYAVSVKDMPQTMSVNEAKAQSYLQRAYFSLEQALFYTDKSRSAGNLKSFDYDKLLSDLERIRKDLETYLYPRNEKITGDSIPFRIDGDYFLEDIINSK